MSEWIKTKDLLPEFNTSVICYCEIYGRFLGYYERISGTCFGQWCSWNGKKGILPPTHWMQIPEPPESP